MQKPVNRGRMGQMRKFGPDSLCDWSVPRSVTPFNEHARAAME